MSRSITITMRFDERLQEITNTPESKTTISVDADVPFAFAIHALFMQYPKIQYKYGPGLLNFKLNGKTPKEYTPIYDGDVVDFFVM